MSDLAWFTAGLPRDVGLKDVTAVLRQLAYRPRLGLLQRTPVVVFEAWSAGGQVSWRIGIDKRIANGLPAQLVAQLPRLTLTPLTTGDRPTVQMASTVRTTSIMSPLGRNSNACWPSCEPRAASTS